MNGYQGETDNRAHERKDVMADASIMYEGFWHDCRIINISVGGAKLSIRLGFQAGDVVQLRIGSFGEFNGVVAWNNSQEVGIRFTHDALEMGNVVMGLAMYG